MSTAVKKINSRNCLRLYCSCVTQCSAGMIQCSEDQHFAEFVGRVSLFNSVNIYGTPYILWPPIFYQIITVSNRMEGSYKNSYKNST
jgi:hypothetical protein